MGLLKHYSIVQNNFDQLYFLEDQKPFSVLRWGKREEDKKNGTDVFGERDVIGVYLFSVFVSGFELKSGLQYIQVAYLVCAFDRNGELSV